MNTIELPSKSSPITADIFQRTDGTFGFDVKDGDMATLDLGTTGNRPYATVEECESAARDRVEFHRLKKAQAVAKSMDRTSWRPVKHVV